MEGSITESATGMSNVDNDWQRPANPETSVGGMAMQRPAKQTGLIGNQMVLAVGIWYLTQLWRGLPVVKSASGVGAGAPAWVRWAMDHVLEELVGGSAIAAEAQTPPLDKGCW